MFDDLIKKKQKWGIIFIDCNPIKITEKGFKIWGQQKTLGKPKKPPVVWNIIKHKPVEYITFKMKIEK